MKPTDFLHKRRGLLTCTDVWQRETTMLGRPGAIRLHTKCDCGAERSLAPSQWKRSLALSCGSQECTTKAIQITSRVKREETKKKREQARLQAINKAREFADANKLAYAARWVTHEG